MDEISIIIAGVSKIGKSRLIDTISLEIGDQIKKNRYFTQMIFRGSDTLINLHEYTIYQPYLEGPCSLSKDDPFITGKPDIFYFLIDNLNMNSITNLSTWLVFLKGKKTRIKILDMCDAHLETDDTLCFPIIHPGIEDYIGQKIQLKHLNVQEIRNDINELINEKNVNIVLN